MRSLRSSSGDPARLALAILLTQACGGDRGQAPSALGTAAPAAGVSFSVVSGETQMPVAGARVIISGSEHVSDPQGRVTAAPGLPSTAFVDVVAVGFFDRQTQLSQRGSAEQLTLWPRDSPTGLTEHFTSEIVYTTSLIGVEPVPGGAALTRWAATVSQVGVLYLGPGDDPNYLEFGGRALAVQGRAVDELNHASGARVVYGRPVPAGSPTGAAGRVELRIYPDFGPCRSSSEIWGVATLPEGEIASATVTYCHQRAAEELGLSVHELGHTFGLRHSSDASDVMRAFGRRTQRLSDRERLVMTLMLQRRGGNRFPDNDRSATASSRQALDVACRP